MVASMTRVTTQLYKPSYFRRCNSSAETYSHTAVISTQVTTSIELDKQVLTKERTRQQVSPTPEGMIYKELCRLRTSSAPAGWGVGFLQALRFAVVVTGSSLAKPILASKRVVGSAYGPMQGKERKHRAALTLRQLIALEKFVCSAPSVLDVAISGQVLFRVYAQARWSESEVGGQP